MCFQVQAVHKTVLIKIIISTDWQRIDTCTCDGTRKLRELHDPHTNLPQNNFSKFKSNTGGTCVRVSPTASPAEKREIKKYHSHRVSHTAKKREQLKTVPFIFKPATEKRPEEMNQIPFHFSLYFHQSHTTMRLLPLLTFQKKKHRDSFSRAICTQASIRARMKRL